MLLKDQITEDMKTAMRAKDSERLGTIRLLLAACKQKEVDERIVLDDAAVVAIVDKLIKQRKDSIAAFEQAARQDLADKEASEMKVLQAYLPQRMGAEEVAAEVRAIVAELKRYDTALHRKPRWLVFNKIDLVPQDERAELIGALRRRLRSKAPAFAISAATGEGCRELMWAVQRFLFDAAAAADESASSDPRFKQ